MHLVFWGFRCFFWKRGDSSSDVVAESQQISSTHLLPSLETAAYIPQSALFFLLMPRGWCSITSAGPTPAPDCPARPVSC